MNSIIIPNGGGKSKNEKLFGTLYYEVLTILDLTIPEYLYLDMVHQLSQKYQWCFKSLDNIASHMNMHRNGVAKIRDRLVSRGLLEKGDKNNRVKTTDMYAKCIQSVAPQKNAHSVSRYAHSVGTERTPSVHKNYNRITKDNKEAFKRKEESRSLGKGYAQAKAMRQKLSAVMSTS